MALFPAKCRMLLTYATFRRRRQNRRRDSFHGSTQELQMHTLRFGRKLSLPSTIAIKHHFRTLVARDEVAKAKAEVEVVRGEPGLAASSTTPMSEINAGADSGRILRL
jgi:hypothetical protein